MLESICGLESKEVSMEEWGTGVEREKEKEREKERTWMMPLMRHTPFFIITICESSGCKDLSSCLTSSILALWSLVNCSARMLFDLPKVPITARESPKLAICSVPLHITPTRQQDPTAAINGFSPLVLRTRVRNSSSVAEKASLRTCSDMVPFSRASPVNRKLQSTFSYTTKIVQQEICDQVLVIDW